MVVLGLLSLAIPAGVKFVEGDTAGALIVFGSGFFLAGASTVCGSAVGFLFGVPRHNESSPGPGAQANAKREDGYHPNTNLEQISDWLTKIIVGIGLVQFPEGIALLKTLGTTAGPAFGTSPSGEIIAISLVVHYLLVGFFQGFLLAYLWLPGAFSRATSIIRDRDLAATVDYAKTGMVGETSGGTNLGESHLQPE